MRVAAAGSERGGCVIGLEGSARDGVATRWKRRGHARVAALALLGEIAWVAAEVAVALGRPG
jgi:hypothetical protein